MAHDPQGQEAVAEKQPHNMCCRGFVSPVWTERPSVPPKDPGRTPLPKSMTDTPVATLIKASAVAGSGQLLRQRRTLNASSYKQHDMTKAKARAVRRARPWFPSDG